MTSIKIVLYKSKTYSTGEHPIYLRLIENRKSKYIPVGAKCLPSLWDDKTNLPSKKHPHFNQLNILISQKKLEAERLLLNLISDDKDFTADQMKITLKNVKKKILVYAYFETKITQLKSEERLGYADIFNSTMKNLQKFKSNDFNFNDVNTTFINEFIETLKSNDVRENSIFVYLRTFKTLINYAKKDNVVKEGFNPFKDISFAKYRKIKTQKRAIKLDKTAEIEAMKFKLESQIWHSKNYYLFSYYTMGTNFIDMAKLTWDDVTNDLICYNRTKTKKEYKTPLNAKAKGILDYYKSVKRDKYVFPILSETSHLTSAQKYNRVKTVLKQFNSDLKEIGRKLGLELKLTSYVARHTAATTLKRSGQSTQVIKELMGHDSERTTEIYLDELDNTVLQNAVDSL